MPSAADAVVPRFYRQAGGACRGARGTYKGVIFCPKPAGDAMKPPRRRFLQLAASAAALAAMSRIAGAQAYPARPVRIIVGYAAGGGTDISAGSSIESAASAGNQLAVAHDNCCGRGSSTAAEQH
jgi:hypothetical protein